MKPCNSAPVGALDDPNHMAAGGGGGSTGSVRFLAHPLCTLAKAFEPFACGAGLVFCFTLLFLVAPLFASSVFM